MIEHIPSIMMLYRQHENNALGANVEKYGRAVGMKEIIHDIVFHPVLVFSKARGVYISKKKQMELFISRYYSKLSPERQQQVDIYMQLFGKNRIKRFTTALQLDYKFNKGVFRKIVIAIKSFLF